MHFWPTYAHMHIFAHNYAYLHSLIHEDATVFKQCTHYYAYRSLIMDTRVLFLHSVRLQGDTNRTPFCGKDM